MWELLKNDLYLFLLMHQHEYEGVNYQRLAEPLGKTRQTIQKYFMVLLEEDVINVDERGLIVVDDIYNLNQEEMDIIKEYYGHYSSYFIAYTIYKMRFPLDSDSKMGRMLNLNRMTIAKYKKKSEKLEIDNSCIYAIVNNRIIKYVAGTTRPFNIEIKEQRRLRGYVNDKDFIILEKCNVDNVEERERFYIDLFKPVWNKK